MEEEDLNDGEENQLNLNLSSTSSDSSDSTGDERSGLTRDDSSFRRMARVVHRTRNRLDIELNEDVESTESSSENSSDDSEGSGVETREEKHREEKAMLEINFPTDKNSRCSSLGSDLTKLVRKRSICYKRKRDESFKSLNYRDAVYRYNIKGKHELKGHTGCVNSLGWSSNGSRLVSGSDDLHLCIWDPFYSKALHRFKTGHRSNIFQTKFLPYSNNQQIISSARDGQIRLTQLASGGTGAPIRYSSSSNTRLLGEHEDAAHKLTFIPQTQVILSCGEDGVVFRIDSRIKQSGCCQKLLTKENIPLYSIDCSVRDTHFAVAGRNSKAFVYDIRTVTPENDTPLMELSPENFGKSKSTEQTDRRENSPNITCLKYSYTGEDLLMSYNDDDIYLMNLAKNEVVQKYRGHRNMQTIKGVSFYGERSEFVVSGSDCGHFYIWDTKDGSLINSQFGDGELEMDTFGRYHIQEAGVVNVTEPCPSYPIMATSGLDPTIKIWSPSFRNFLHDKDAIDATRKRTSKNLRNRHCKNQEIGLQQWSHVLQLLRRQQTREIRNRRLREGIPIDDLDEASSEEEVDPSQCRAM